MTKHLRFAKDQTPDRARTTYIDLHDPPVSRMTARITDIPLIITSAINACAERTQLRSNNERLRLTLEGLREWMSHRVFRRIVVCDGTGFDLTPHLNELNRPGLS